MTLRQQFPRTYESWKQMRKRCLSPTNDNYPRYGGRGITISPFWDSFEEFLKDMGSRPKDFTLERIDNACGYFAWNCRWATRKEQQHNTRGIGVWWHRGQQKWQAEIEVNGKRKHLGTYYSYNAACDAYFEAKKNYHKSQDTRPEFLRREEDGLLPGQTDANRRISETGAPANL